MYTLVLMSALGSAPESGDFNGFFRDLFSFRGGCRGADDDRSTSRDSGGNCYGCCGGLFHGGVRNWLNGCHGSCTGCCGGSGRAAAPSRAGGTCQGGSGCSGSVAADRGYSCNGGGYSGYATASCMGSSPGSCFGSPGSGCFGTPTPGGFGLPPGGGGQPYPGDFATPRPVDSYFPPYRSDSYPVGPPVIVSPPSGFDSYPPSPAPPSVGEERGTMSTLRPSRDGQRGTVWVKLPPDAKLYAEGRPLSQTAGERKFVTPPLPSDREAVYTFRVEYVRDGRVLSESQKVQVKAGGTATVEFADLTAARPNGKSAELYATGSGVKMPPTIVPPTSGDGERKSLLPPVTAKPAVPADRAKIVVKLPPGATLFVDGRRNERTDAVREFTTPQLAPGKEYAYTMKAEWRRNGQPETQEQRIEFRGGEQLTVDFTSGPGQERASR